MTSHSRIRVHTEAARRITYSLISPQISPTVHRDTRGRSAYVIVLHDSRISEALHRVTELGVTVNVMVAFEQSFVPIQVTPGRGRRGIGVPAVMLETSSTAEAFCHLLEYQPTDEIRLRWGNQTFSVTRTRERWAYQAAEVPAGGGPGTA
ncbi:hypothetical protein M2390_000797 [Mycetocola sp. BIGb0189]|nr:hypothetical protein [Mycetocola sp. BIGb0189]